MKVLALSFIVLLLGIQAEAQTIDDIIQFIFDHSTDCGDPFSDPVWVPALDLCTIGCDTLGEICMEDADLNQRCDPLPDKCTAGLKQKYPNAIGKKTKPHPTSKPGATTEAPIGPEEEKRETTDGAVEPDKPSGGTPFGPETEEGYGESTEAPAGETATEAPIEEKEEPSVETTEAPVAATEAPPPPPVEPAPYTEPPPQPPALPPQPPAPLPQPQPQPGGYGSAGPVPGPPAPPAPAGYGATGGVGAGAGGGGGQGAARDYHTWCCKWAYEGQCNARPVSMRPLCQKSCGTYGCRAENALSCPVTVNVSPDTCWQLRGKSGNPDRDPSHFQPQPGAIAPPFTITEVGAPVPKQLAQPQPPPKKLAQDGQAQSYQQPAAAPQPSPSLPSAAQAPAAYQPAPPPQQAPSLPPPPQPSAPVASPPQLPPKPYSQPNPEPQAQSYSQPVPKPEPKPESDGGYRRRLLLQRRFYLLRRLRLHRQ